MTEPDPNLRRVGESVEARFRALTGATRALRATDGDALLDGHLVELKWAGSGVANGIRPVKYLPVVIRTPDAWYVVPPQEIVRIACRRPRGATCESAFETMLLRVGEMSGFYVPESRLREAVLAAVSSGAAWPELRELMRVALDFARSMQEATRDNAEALLAAGPECAPALPDVSHQLSLLEVAA